MGTTEEWFSEDRRGHLKNRSGLPGNDCILEKDISEKEGLNDERNTNRGAYEILWKVPGNC